MFTAETWRDPDSNAEDSAIVSQGCPFRPLLKPVSLKSPFKDWKQQNLLVDVTFAPVCAFDAIKTHQQSGEHHQARRLR